MGLLRGAIFHHCGMLENSLNGAFPLLVGRFPTLMGLFPECLNGPFSLLRTPGRRRGLGALIERGQCDLGDGAPKRIVSSCDLRFITAI